MCNRLDVYVIFHYHCVDISAGGLLLLKGITAQYVNASPLIYHALLDIFIIGMFGYSIMQLC